MPKAKKRKANGGRKKRLSGSAEHHRSAIKRMSAEVYANGAHAVRAANAGHCESAIAALRHVAMAEGALMVHTAEAGLGPTPPIVEKYVKSTVRTVQDRCRRGG